MRLSVAARLEISPLAELEVFQLVRADGFSVELGDADVETEEHSFDLVMEALVNRQAAGGFR